ncbi:MAG: adenylate kinase [Clostridiales bacterium]|nr:adenylate kinase [Clostridiales bacterium]
MERLIFLGPPGAGKGTQAVKVAEHFGIAHISTGDMLRAEMRGGTALGMAAKSYIDKGELVPDNVLIAMVRERVQAADCANGFLLDGFPRTTAQADALASFSEIDRVINIEVPFELLLARICGRRMCAACGKAYHTSTHESELCSCGETLYQRDDDRAETVSRRLRAYETNTAPLIDYYSACGLLETVRGDQGIAKVAEDIFAALNG